MSELSSCSSAKPGVDDIHHLLEQHRARKSLHPSQLPGIPEFSSIPSIPRAQSSYHPVVSEISSLPYSPVKWNLESSASSASTPSVFDSASSHASMSTAPDILPLGQNRGPYPCEFVGYLDCRHTFRMGEEGAWFAHIAAHLGNVFPRKSLCWFCDDFSFESDSDDQYQLMLVFRQRMDHIVQHLRTQNRPIRPDFFFLDHILELGIVDESAREKAGTFYENPFSFPQDMTPGDPPKREVGGVITTGGGRGGVSRREKRYRS